MDENRVIVAVPKKECMSCPSTATQEAPGEPLSNEGSAGRLWTSLCSYLYINSGLLLTHQGLICAGGHSGDWASIPKELTF